MGAILAIRIYVTDHYTPMADLKTVNGEVITIRWTDVEARKQYEPFITGYTLIYDERPKRTWDEW